MKNWFKSIAMVIFALLFAFAFVSCETDTESDPTYYTVSFNSDGGTSVASQTVESGKTATKPANPTKDGYTFAEWYNGASIFDFTTPITADITLTAHWTKNAVTPTNPETPSGAESNTNGNSGNSDEKSSGKSDDSENNGGGNNASENSQANTENDANNTDKNDDNNSNANENTENDTNANDTTDTPAVTYKITFDANGGDSNWGKTWSQVGSEGEKIKIKTVNEVLLKKQTSVGSFTFIGWYTEKGEFYCEDGAEIVLTKNLTLRAHWEQNTAKYTIQHLLQNMSASTDGYDTIDETQTQYGKIGELTTATAKTKDGFVACDIEQQTIKKNGSTVVNVYYNRIPITLTFDPKGGTFKTNGGTWTDSDNGTKNEIGRYGVVVNPPKDPQKTGYSGSWDKSIQTTFKYDEIYTAVYEAVQYSITYNLDGGTNASENPSTYTIETDTFSLFNPQKDDYDFVGWYNGESKVTQIEKGTTGNLELTAKWEESLAYSDDAPSVGDIVFENGRTASPENYVTDKDSYESKNGKPVGIVAFFLDESPSRSFSAEKSYPVIGNRKNAYIVGLQRKSTSWVSSSTYYDIATNSYKSIDGYKMYISKSKASITTTYYANSEKPTYLFSDDSNLTGSSAWKNLCDMVNDEDATDVNIGAVYKAFYYVNNYGKNNELSGVYEDGWYLPSIFELLHFNYNWQTIIKSMEKLDSNWDRLTAKYISSSQYDQKDSSDYYSYIYFLQVASPEFVRKDTTGIAIAVHKLTDE